MCPVITAASVALSTWYALRSADAYPLPLVKTNVDVATIPHPLPVATPGYAVSRLPLLNAMRAAFNPLLAHTYTISPTAYIFHMAVVKK